MESPADGTKDHRRGQKDYSAKVAGNRQQEGRGAGYALNFNRCHRSRSGGNGGNGHSETMEATPERLQSGSQF